MRKDSKFKKLGSAPDEVAGFPPGRTGDYLVPNGTLVLGSDSFANCGLSTVTFSTPVSTLGDRAFDQCTSLTDLFGQAGHPELVSDDGVLFTADRTELVQYPPGRAGPFPVPDDLVTIGHYAFFTCEGLTDLVIPATVTALGESAFLGCRNVRTIYFAGDAPLLENNPFESTGTGFLISTSARNLRGAPMQMISRNSSFPMLSTPPSQPKATTPFHRRSASSTCG